MTRPPEPPRVICSASWPKLAQLRNDIAEKKIPLAQEINQLENLKIELTHQRDEVVEQATGVNRIKAELEQRDSELARQNDYLHTALGNYIEEFLGNALHVGEIQLYSEVVDRARNAKDNAEIPLRERYEMQVAVLRASLGRLEKMVAGYTFEGECEVEGGDLVQGNFAIVGPIWNVFPRGNSGAGRCESFGSATPSGSRGRRSRGSHVRRRNNGFRHLVSGFKAR